VKRGLYFYLVAGSRRPQGLIKEYHVFLFSEIGWDGLLTNKQY